MNPIVCKKISWVWLPLVVILFTQGGCHPEPVDYSDHQPPVIVITDPLPDTYQIKTIPVLARAGDNTGLDKVTIEIRHVESDTILLPTIRMVQHPEIDATYRYTWDTLQLDVPDGTYEIHCVATDLGERTNEDSIIIFLTNDNPGLALGDSVPPSMTITKPYSSTEDTIAEEDTWVHGQLWIKGTARDNIGVERMDMVANDNVLGEATVSGVNHWEYVWDTTQVDDGNYILEIRGYDEAALMGSAQVEVVVDNTPPEVVIINPLEGDVIGDDENPHDPNYELVIEGSAMDIHGIEKAEVQVDGMEYEWAELSEDLGSEQDGTYNWVYTYDPTELGLGMHTLTVRVVDTLGNSTWESVTIETPVYVSVFTGDGTIGMQEGGPPLASYPGTKANFTNPTSLAVDPSGSYIYTVDDGIFRKIILNNGYVFNINVLGLDGVPLHGLAVDENYAYVSNDSLFQLSRVTIHTGQIMNTWAPLTTPESYNGMGLALTNTTLYTISKASGNLLKIDVENPQEGYTYGSSLPVTNPVGLAVNSSYLYISTLDQYRVFQINLQDETVGVLAGGAAPGDADGIGSAARFQGMNHITASERYAYLCQTNHVIRRIDLVTKEVRTLAGLAGISGNVNGRGADARFNNPLGIVVVDKDLFVVDQNNRCIRRITNFW
jgi:hypothetical protein